MTLTEHTELPPLADQLPQQFWTGTSYHAPAAYEVDCTPFEMSDADLDPDSELARLMQRTYDDVGLVLLRNTGLTDPARMRQFAQVIVREDMVYEGGANPRDKMEGNVYEIGAPLVARLPYHHEMAYLGKSTSLISFLCLDPLPDAGATFVSDGVASTDAMLATPLGQKLKDLGVYNHWQKSFGTDDPAVAQTKAEALGLIVEWGESRLMKTRYYNPAFEYFPTLGRNMLYASLADHGLWFDTWPLVQHLPFTDRPLHMTYGDDSEFTRDELQQFIDVYDKFGTKIDWERGDIAVICNYRFAHGRPEIVLGEGESRKLGVLLGEEFDRVGQRNDKW
jgi:hypothetical protein